MLLPPEMWRRERNNFVPPGGSICWYEGGLDISSVGHVEELLKAVLPSGPIPPPLGHNQPSGQR